MPELTFKKVDASNYWDVIGLNVADSQKNFVAPNDKSLLQSAYEAPEASTPYGIYTDDTLIGFLLITSDDETPDTLWVWRFMIDEQHQGKGYGKAAIQKLLSETKAEGKYAFVRLSYEPENSGAAHVYKSLGFVEEGIKEEWGEMVVACDLSKIE